MLRLHLVGQLAGMYAEKPLAMPASARARALIGWLGLHPGLQPRGRVAAALWPDVDEGVARARLRTAVWAVRQAWGSAGEQVLRGRRETLGFAADDLVVDALTEPASDQPWPAGELLPGLDDEWVEQAREELVDRQQQRLRQLTERALAAGRSADAVDWARRRCALVRFDESAHRALVRALVADGDRAGATEAVQRFADRLRTELDVSPSPATRTLHADVEAGAPLPSAPMIFGRSAELGALQDRWRAAARGRAQVVLVTGEPGIGKTTLLEELARRARSRGALTAKAAGLDVGGSMPFAVWLELARALAEQVRRPPLDAGWPVELNRLSMDLGAALGRPGAVPPATTPELERLRAFEASLRLVEWSAEQRPVLLVLDDAHRADRVSLQLLAHLARRVVRMPVALVLACPDRVPEAVDALVDSAARAGVEVTRTVLGPIDAPAVAALAASLGIADDREREQVMASAEGNPLLAAETARALRVGQVGPPPNLRAAVRAATGRLGQPGRMLSALLAAAGRPLTAPELARLGDSADPAAVAEVLVGGLVSRTDGRLGFRHGLLREAAYVDLDDPVPLHARLAEVIDPTQSAEVAGHWERAGRGDLAADAWVRVAAYARSVGALTEAAEALTTAVRLAPDRTGAWVELVDVDAHLGRRTEEEWAWRESLQRLRPDQLADAWCRRGDQFRSISCDPPRSWAAYREAQLHLGTAGPTDDDLSIRLALGLAWNEAVAGDPGRAMVLIEDLEQALPPDADVRIRSDLVEVGMQSLIRQGRFAEAVDLARTITDDPALRRASRAHWAIASNAAGASLCAGDDEGALAFIEDAVANVEDIPAVLTPTLGSLAHLQARTGRTAEARASLAQMRRLVERLDVPDLTAKATVDHGLVELALGEPTLAAELLGEALAHSRTSGRPSVAVSRAEALALAGEPDAAAAQLRAALQEPTARADQPWSLLPRVCFVQALIAEGRGDQAEALRRLEESVRAWQPILTRAQALTSEGYLAVLIDIGRPPVVGLVEPERELARVERMRARLTAVPVVTEVG